MPASSSAGSASASRKKKEDVAEKVREIKQRQQNWLKQREQTKHSDELGAKSKVQQNGSQVKLVRPQKVPSGKKTQQNLPASSSNISSNKTTSDVKDKFKLWRTARAQRQPSKDDGDFNDCTSIRSGAESELERLISPELETVRQPVAEENFDDLANQIAERVKGDLGLEQNGLHLSPIPSAAYHTDGESSNDHTWNSSRCKTFTREVPTFNHLGTSGLTSHTCTVCKKLMLSSSHIPMMVIPCGHTLCKSCSEGRSYCPSCDCPVVSLTVNIMLQQVIQEYHAHPKASSSHNNDTQDEITVDIVSPGGRNYSPGKYVEDNRRNRMASYKKQLVSLQTRHEVLSNEHDSLSEKREKVNKSLHHEQTQVQNIRKQEEEVSRSISELQERLGALQEHRQQYEVKVSELQDESSEVDGKVHLLSSTLASLNREIEKVKLLAEGEADN
ncbi:uncharacterized protein LOC101859639 [Aplysia californica]|uniref:Uncharacterized protein LOC101859639 n=1 Tax=Aplysia californica TaxID=6500 RepID=A0ABM0JQ07_APLCA|nr:uncharacterized protein LOC101859639 [Aplysia californica]